MGHQCGLRGFMNRPLRTRMMGGVGGEGETPSSTRLAGWQRRDFNLDTDHLWEDVIRFVSKTVLFLE